LDDIDVINTPPMQVIVQLTMHKIVFAVC